MLRILSSEISSLKGENIMRIEEGRLVFEGEKTLLSEIVEAVKKQFFGVSFDKIKVGCVSSSNGLSEICFGPMQEDDSGPTFYRDSPKLILIEQEYKDITLADLLSVTEKCFPGQDPRVDYSFSYEATECYVLLKLD